ncbi:Coq4 family protein [Sphingomonas sp. AR_OL41]|uniref:Coq4 family protein n=1 Tax=Sphingomonas sp. AR_OL41 TaxID=3042729 RepID=UPI00248083B1|nr:Coq4 family protein [Sphingomonas sp. AR_OL41]MDH7973937.1 Coq4 family protein [Sphingomonas sp. AR_OL41]
MAATLPPFPGTTGRRDWRTAFDAIGKLMANGDDTTQVFRIMRALNVGATPKSYAQFIATEEGGRMAYERVELAEVLSRPGFAQQFAPGTVGAAYRHFLESTGYSADGLAEVSKINREEDMPHPYAWFGRRVRDTHDIWHVMTGYKADESLGEAALVAFSYAQVGGLGWAFIGSAAALKSLRVTKSTLFARAVWEGYRRGKQAKWLAGEDYLKLLHEPIEAARARLGLRAPVAYLTAQRELGAEMASYLSRRESDKVAEPTQLAA